jgi:galactose-1-phosphate uridylyltransferase
VRGLSKEKLDALIQCNDISSADYSDLISWVSEEPGLAKFAPDEICRIDPRNRRMTIYNAARSKRPHDNRNDEPPRVLNGGKPCPICDGNTTRPIDVAPLSDGYTFINKNLFPCFFNTGESMTAAVVPDGPLRVDAGKPVGNHFLQWTSTLHDRDWHNMTLEDLCVVFRRLGVFEKHLLTSSGASMPDTSEWYGASGVSGFVLAMKNFGAQVGGSLSHGHQQITHSNVMSKSAFEDWQFLKRHGIPFSAYLRQHTSESLRLLDLNEAEVVVPYFMRRPMGAMLLLKDDSKRLISDLSDKECWSVVEGISRILQVYHRLMPDLGRDVAYNVLFHTGPGAGIYVEFLPYTQETGGMEQLGLWVCQDTPEGSAAVLREYLS